MKSMELLQLSPANFDSTYIVATKEQVSSDLGGEVVILNVQSGLYYGLNEVGARVWSLIQQPKLIREIRDTLLQEYAVEPEECDRDLLQILQDLNSAELIQVSHEAAA